MKHDEIENIIIQINNSINQERKLIDSETSEFSDWSDLELKPIEEWSSKDFVVYFKDIYYDIIGKEYNITFAIDNPEMQKIKSELSKSGLKSKKDLKLFLDWTKINKSEILSKKPNFMIHDLKLFINNFIYENKKVDLPNDSEFLERINKKIKNGISLGNLLELYGIPIMATYMKTNLNKNENNIYSNIEKRLINMINNKKINTLIKTAKQSINMSPYPTEFILLEWRKKYESLWNKIDCKSQNWWRNNDYVSDIPKHYMDLVNVRE